MKTCTRCGNDKSFEDFQKRKASKDGYTSACKKCLSDYDKSRANQPHRIAARKEYINTPLGKAARKRATDAYRRRNPNKYRAHNAVNNGLRDGKIERLPCERCKSKKSVAHHDDYLKPLDVRWLCYKHHKEWHKINGEGKNQR